MKVLVTGANGLLGQKLIELLQKQNEVVAIATSRGDNRNVNLNKSTVYHSLDVEKAHQVKVLFNAVKPDVVIHTAAMTNVDQCELNQEACIKANIDAVRNIISACEAVGSKLIHLSTDFIFDGSKGPLKEDEKPNPVNFYGESKLQAEQLIISSSLQWSIARTVLVYGIVQGLSRSNIILWVKENLEKKNNIKVVNDQWRTPTLAEDLAMGCWLIAKHNAQGIFNISGKDLLTPFDMAHIVADYYGLSKEYITKADSSTFSQPAKRPPRTGFIIEKAQNELGFDPHSFMEGIELVTQQLQKA